LMLPDLCRFSACEFAVCGAVCALLALPETAGVQY
jgi:hypothetical protein